MPDLERRAVAFLNHDASYCIACVCGFFVWNLQCLRVNTKSAGNATSRGQLAHSSDDISSWWEAIVV